MTSRSTEVTYRSIYESTPSDRSTILVMITVAAWIIYIGCLIMCAILYMTKKWRLKPKKVHSTITLKNQLRLIGFFILKIFYTFLFTFSTFLTLILTVHDHQQFAPVNDSSEKYSLSSTGQNLSSLNRCSRLLTVNLRQHLARFNEKRQENLVICSNSSQSVESESRKLMDFHRDKYVSVYRDNWQTYWSNCALESENFRKQFLDAIGEICQSKWLSHVENISHRSKVLYRENFDYLFWQKYMHEPVRIVKFMKLMNLSELISPYFLLSQLEYRYRAISISKSQRPDRLTSFERPSLLMNISSTFKYIEKISTSVRETKRKNVSKVLYRKFLNKKKSQSINLAFFDTIVLRIVMLILDSMMIAHRSYRIYCDMRLFWVGKKTFLEYKTYGQCCPIKNDSFIESETSFKQLTSKITPWTKRQNMHCFNSPDLMLTIQIMIGSVIVTSLLVCLFSRETSIFLLPLVTSHSRAESWWIVPYKRKSIEITPTTALANEMKERQLNILRDIITYRYNVTSRFNYYEANVVSQYMWEQCTSERQYEKLSKQSIKTNSTESLQPRFCQTPIPHDSVLYRKTFCNDQWSMNKGTVFHLPIKNAKKKSKYIQVLRYHLVECVVVTYTMILTALAVLGVLKLFRKNLLTATVSDYRPCVLIIPQTSSHTMHSVVYLDRTVLQNRDQHSEDHRNISKKSYSCQR